MRASPSTAGAPQEDMAGCELGVLEGERSQGANLASPHLQVLLEHPPPIQRRRHLRPRIIQTTMAQCFDGTGTC